MKIALSTIAGRSGDKGNHANIAIIAYTQAACWLRTHLTAVVRVFCTDAAKPGRRFEAEVWGSIFCCTTFSPAERSIVAIIRKGKTLSVIAVEIETLPNVKP